LVKTEPWIRLDVVDTTYDRIIDVFVALNKELKENDRLFVTTEESDLILDKIKLEIMRTRVLGWIQPEELPSEQMTQNPKGNHYG
jgi:hypothetical protein